MLKPAIRWVGSKRTMLRYIRNYYPENIDKYCEPFVGGGSVLMDVLNRYEPSEIYISDVNKSLISTYKAIRDEMPTLKDRLTKYQERYDRMTEPEREEQYYIDRNRYNELEPSMEKTELFIVLNYTSYNGLYRENLQGKMNVASGDLSDGKKLWDIDNMETLSRRLKKAKIICADYKKSKDFVDKDTFVYLDPPYKDTFGKWQAKKWDGADSLYEYVDEIADVGARVVVSNNELPKGLKADFKMNIVENPYNFKHKKAKEVILSVKKKDLKSLC